MAAHDDDDDDDDDDDADGDIITTIPSHLPSFLHRCEVSIMPGHCTSFEHRDGCRQDRCVGQGAQTIFSCKEHFAGSGYLALSSQNA